MTTTPRSCVGAETYRISAVRRYNAASVGDLMPGMCEMVECPWSAAPTTAPGVDVYVVADDGHVAGECREANNVTVFHGVYCGAPM